MHYVFDTVYEVMAVVQCSIDRLELKLYLITLFSALAWKEHFQFSSSCKLYSTNGERGEALHCILYFNSYPVTVAQTI